MMTPSLLTHVCPLTSSVRTINKIKPENCPCLERRCYWHSKVAEAYRQQIELGLDDNPRETAKARIILRDLLEPIQMCPGPDGRLWAEYNTRPAVLVKKAVGANVELIGNGGVICTVPTVRTRVRLK